MKRLLLAPAVFHVSGEVRVARSRSRKVLAGIFRPKMANANRGSTPASLDSLVRHIIEHPDFKQAVNSASSSGVTPSSSSASSPGSCGIVASSSSGIASARATAASGVRRNSLVPCQSVNSRTPREELRQIFHRRNASAPPKFEGRTNWQPAARGRGRQPCNGGGKRSQSAQGRKGKHVKSSKFSREVVLLRHPDDSMVRGAAKAQLQRLGHVISDFQFDKTWNANVVLEKLLSAFETSVPSLAEITCEPK